MCFLRSAVPVIPNSSSAISLSPTKKVSSYTDMLAAQASGNDEKKSRAFSCCIGFDKERDNKRSI